MEYDTTTSPIKPCNKHDTLDKEKEQEKTQQTLILKLTGKLLSYC